jgi:DNA-damage-inducible protein D
MSKLINPPHAEPAETDDSIERLIAQFEDAAQNEEGVEFWKARNLQTLLGYDKWDNFLKVIGKAKNACESSGHKVSDHFLEVGKVIESGKGAQQTILDIQLTRYACYLIAQNADSRKRPVAFAQTYFAIQTRRQELSDAKEAASVPFSEDQKRVLLREEIKAHNKKLASAAKGAGVIEPIDFAKFQNFGYQGLYGGLSRRHCQSRQKITKSHQKHQ